MKHIVVFLALLAFPISTNALASNCSGDHTHTEDTKKDEKVGTQFTPLSPKRPAPLFSALTELKYSVGKQRKLHTKVVLILSGGARSAFV